MLKTSFLASSALALTVASSVAFAAQGAYFSADVGRSTFLDMPSSENYGYYNTDLETRSTAFRLALGYSKDVNPDFGVGGELGYNNYGSQTYYGYTYRTYETTLEYKYSSIDLLGKFTWHASPSFDVYGKLGVANEMAKVSGDSNIENTSKVLPELGLGVSYFATEKLSLDLAAYRTQGSEVEFNYADDDNLPSIFTLLFGISYYFD